MKKRLEDTKKTHNMLNKCKKVYLVGCWAKYGVRDYPFAGKFINNDIWYKEPLVWDFDDHNGAHAEYILRPISQTTTGQCIIYCFDENIAHKLADSLNIKYEFDKNYKTK